MDIEIHISSNVSSYLQFFIAGNVTAWDLIQINTKI